MERGSPYQATHESLINTQTSGFTIYILLRWIWYRFHRSPKKIIINILPIFWCGSSKICPMNNAQLQDLQAILFRWFWSPNIILNLRLCNSQQRPPVGWTGYQWWRTLTIFSSTQIWLKFILETPLTALTNSAVVENYYNTFIHTLATAPPSSPTKRVNVGWDSNCAKFSGSKPKKVFGAPGENAFQRRDTVPVQTPCVYMSNQFFRWRGSRERPQLLSTEFDTSS